MLAEVQVYNNQGFLLSMPLGAVTSGIFVAEIQGLDPVKATIVSTSYAMIDGAQYHASRREARNIKLKLGLEPDYINEDPRDVRNRLYGFFMPKTTVDLRFVMDDSTAYLISGRVESFESSVFSQEPMVDISIICFDPDFILGNIEDQYSDVDYQGLYSTTSIVGTNVENIGTVETGILLQFTPDRAVSSFTLYSTTEAEGTQSMAFTLSMLAFDTLQVSTIPGAKKIEHYRSSNLLGSVLYALSPQSDWIKLLPGDNEIRMYESGSGADPLYYLIGHYTRFGGL